MKTSILSKSILVLAVMFLCNLAMSAASPREYMYDTKEENGKVISKVIFLNDNGLLNKEGNPGHVGLCNHLFGGDLRDHNKFGL